MKKLLIIRASLVITVNCKLISSRPVRVYNIFEEAIEVDHVIVLCDPSCLHKEPRTGITHT